MDKKPDWKVLRNMSPSETVSRRAVSTNKGVTCEGQGLRESNWTSRSILSTGENNCSKSRKDKYA